ncbi:MAG: hypothetical protein ACF788_08545 [Novipirellula sp. JB048]
MSKFVYFSSLALATLVVSLTGCNGSSVELVPVSGVVTVAGQPVEGITVTFIRPDRGEGEERIFPYAQTDSSGNFTVKISESEMGAPTGQYSVLFQKLTMPDGSPIPEGEMAIDVGAVNQVPEIYSDPATSPETVTIPEGGTDNLSFDLKAK